MSKRLIKDSSNKVVCGVLAGFAKYFDIDVDILRVLVMFFTKLNQERYNIFSVVYELVFINVDYFP